MQDFKKLSVWEKSHRLTLQVYEATNGFPKHEMYGLTSQVRRSCSSIPTNVAEACGRGGGKEFLRFLGFPSGSAHEVEYLLILARDLGFLETPVYSELNKAILEGQRMLAGLQRTVKSNTENQGVDGRARNS